MRRFSSSTECFELAKPFAISSGTIEALTVLRVEIRDGEHIAQGECVPSAARMVSRQEGRRIAESAREEVMRVQTAVEAGAAPADLLHLMPRGPARNAIDCALWDLAAKQAHRPAAQLLDVTLPDSLVTAYTISLDTPAAMEAAAHEHRNRGLLKLKLGSDADEQIVAAVRRAAPSAKIIVDVNGGWSLERLREMSVKLHGLGISLIEQPLAPGADSALASFDSPIPLAADESCQDRSDLAAVSERYDYINIKLDKTGGLTEALALAREARRLGLGLMVGCMAGTSLSMAPAVIVASLAELVDLDGPLLLANDRHPAMVYRDDRILCSNPQLWG